MSRSLSTRATAAIAILLAVLIGGVLIAAAVTARPALAERRSAPPPPHPPHAPAVPIAEVVRRTLAEPFARVRFELAPRAHTAVAGGPTIAVEGIVGLSSPDADLVASLGGPDDHRMRVRILGDRTWLGLADGSWTRLPPEAMGQIEAFTWWRGFFARLDDDPLTHRPSFDGRPATVDVDAAGRIRRLRITLERSTVDVRLDGYDEQLAMPAPP